MRLGYIGLGKMGKNMVLRMLEQGVEVVAWNRSSESLQEVVNAGAIGSANLQNLVKQLNAPRIIWLMLPQGQPTDDILYQLIPLIQKDDLVIDGANAFYKDSQRRAEELSKKGIHFMDIGVSGGPSGARNGACMMIGGSNEDYLRIEPLLPKISAPSAYALLGPAGAGHFAKMVHNGIEYGMMQAIAEGAAVLEKSGFNYDMAKVFEIYNRKSVIESRLVEWARAALAENSTLDNISSVIAHTGEGEWTVNTAKELGVNVPVIETSYQVRVDSSNEPDNFRNRVVSALRGQFGGHAVKKD